MYLHIFFITASNIYTAQHLGLLCNFKRKSPIILLEYVIKAAVLSRTHPRLSKLDHVGSLEITPSNWWINEYYGWTFMHFLLVSYIGVAGNIFSLAVRGPFCFDLSKCCLCRWRSRVNHVAFNVFLLASRRKLWTSERGPRESSVSNIKQNRSLLKLYPTIFIPHYDALMHYMRGAVLTYSITKKCRAHPIIVYNSNAPFQPPSR